MRRRICLILALGLLGAVVVDQLRQPIISFLFSLNRLAAAQDPKDTVKKELKSKRLVRAAAPGQCELAMEVRIYRERPEMSRHTKPGAQALWEFLRESGA